MERTAVSQFIRNSRTKKKNADESKRLQFAGTCRRNKLDIDQKEREDLVKAFLKG